MKHLVKAASTEEEEEEKEEEEEEKREKGDVKHELVGITLIAAVFPPMAALCIGVSPSFPLKSMWAPLDSSGRMHSM